MLFKTCESEPQLDERNNVISQNCLRCKDNYYFMNGTKDCYNDSIKEQGYYLSSNDLNDQKYYKCDIQCKTCYEKNICIKCNEEKGYYPIYGENSSYCYNNESMGQRYVLDIDSDPFNWIKCYKYCETCNSLGNSTNMNCLSCNKDLINDKTSKPYFFKLKNNGNCIEECSDN